VAGGTFVLEDFVDFLNGGEGGLGGKLKSSQEKNQRK
jgi:hypothetical protein